MPTPENNSPSYGHEDDWKFIDNVKLGSFEFGRDREISLPLVSAVITDVACLVGNPTSDLLQAAELASVSKIDKMVTVWASTLFQSDADGDNSVEPQPGDKLTIDGQLWLIKVVISTIFDTQFKCLCSRLAKA